MDFKSLIGVVLVVLIWGLNFSVIKFGLEEIPPILFSGLRFLVVAIPAVFFIPFPKTSIWNVLGVGVFLGVLKFSFLFVAMESDVSAGLSSLLLQAQVVFTILLSVLLWKESLNRFQLFGMVLACIGFSFFFYTAGGNATTLGITLILCAAGFWSVSNLIMKRMGDVNLLHFMVWVSLIPPIPLFLVSWHFETNQPVSLLLATTEKSWLSLLYVSYISTLAAFALWGWLLKNYPTAVVTPFALLIPVVGIVGSSLLLNEQLSNLEMLGGALILFGLSASVLGSRLYTFISQRIKLKGVTQRL
ncbi:MULTISPECIES: EamA family transporter [Vibrio]|uniref:EamA family transporter n=1 Tax=Vibrio TaxID=662 RepID=UPI0020757097|nr:MULTISPECIES: EamA family transporter [Vibrio]USD34786.1 EamA family transporter [Vibrio sp. SCSIO 43186]USD47851.1 EamA family transporter [Vibrio sp. SCSIO 43145]USD71911.1 EamA family transporter [Vibrio sp. SCSIO 43139]USD97572.1 permease [Vibrio coralliilyticus]